jgi:hypothetical protein
VRLEAVRDLVTIFHGKAAEKIIVQEEKGSAHGTPEELTPAERTAALLRVLGVVGALPAAAAAVRAGQGADAEVEQVPGEDAPAP